MMTKKVTKQNQILESLLIQEKTQMNFATGFSLYNLGGVRLY